MVIRKRCPQCNNITQISKMPRWSLDQIMITGYMYVLSTSLIGAVYVLLFKR